MTIQFYTLRGLKPVSKPRGQIGKHGNMTHSIGAYRGFQVEVSERLKQLEFAIPGEFFSLAYIFYMAKKKGQQNDITNMTGAIEDILVKYKYLTDDNWQVLRRCYIEAVPSPTFAITILVLPQERDFYHFVANREKFLALFI